MKIYIPGIAISLLLFISCMNDQEINRYDLVTRYNIGNSVIDSLNSLSVGNSEFVFTVDATGLQTFPDYYKEGIALGTMSYWGWHSFENPENFSLENNYREYEVNGRQVKYLCRPAIYLPVNGGLLTVVAKISICSQFPHDGRWKVRWEKLNEYID